ncbi:hypothetical protein CYMTET_28854, partial [Cymbomonas tetramitiformis]
GDISGTVNVSEEWLEHLSVVLVSSETPDMAEKSMPLSYSRLFHFSELPFGKYIVRLECSLSQRSYIYDQEEKEVALEGPHVHLEPMTFTAEMRSDKNPDFQQSSMAPVIFTLISVACIAYLDQIREWRSGMAGMLKKKEELSENEWTSNTNAHQAAPKAPRKPGSKRAK